MLSPQQHIFLNDCRGKAIRGKAARAIDSDAEEGSEESDVQTESDIGMEEAAADNTSYVALHGSLFNVLQF